MTEKLFLNDSYINEFKANIVEIVKVKENYGIVLDKTYFYPENGGQPSDLGTIDSVEVIDVYYFNDKIIHLISEEIEKKEVVCKLNFERRFDLMQQHLGQHILSRCLEIKHEANTVGFHIGDDYVTIDIDKKLNNFEIDEIEKFSNEMVFKNLKVNILYPTEEELKALPLRKQPSVSENIRIVEIDKFDYSPCGGTHPKTTSEVGLIKIKKIKNHKNGLRIEFVCGRWALNDYRYKNEYINEISDMFAIKDIQVKERVMLLNNELIESKKKIDILKDELLEYEMKNIENDFILKNNIKIIGKYIDDKSIKDLRAIGNAIIQKDNYLICLISNENNKANMVIGKSKNLKVDSKEMFNKYIALLNGKGGGSPFLLQGSGDNIIEVENIISDFLKAEF